MRINPDGSVTVEAGDVRPIHCDNRYCRHIYEVREETDATRCPKCGYWNLHCENGWETVQEKARAYQTPEKDETTPCSTLRNAPTSERNGSRLRTVLRKLFRRS